MPKKLKIHPNERVDISDFTWGTSGYANAKTAQTHKLLGVGNSSQTLGGFRIVVENQTLYPGQITIYNGAYIAATGELVTNEDSIQASETISLTGSNQTFYVELEPYDDDSDPDDRAIWDPTYDNGVGKQKGREFLDEVTTRVNTIWRAVSPVSTSAFTVSSDPATNRLPLAILKTNGTGQITIAVNPGMQLGPFSTVLAEDAAASASSFKVLDATLLPEPGDGVSLNFESLTIQTVDRANGLFTTTTGLASAAPRGTPVFSTDAREFIDERTSAAVELSGLTSTHPDKLLRLFSANESRGRTLMASKYLNGDRDDLNLHNLKDYVDFLASQIREMKVGKTDSSTTPPADSLPVNFSTIRYYDFVGSIQGAKESTFTIGNGSSSFGDFNGTDHLPFQTAINTAVSMGLTDVIIFVKRGTYTFTSSVNSSINVIIIGEADRDSGQVTISSGSMTSELFTITGVFSIRNVQILRPTSSTTSAFIVAGSTAAFYAERMATGSLLSPLLSSATTLRAFLKYCNINSGGTVSTVVTCTNDLYFTAEDTTVSISGASTNFMTSTAGTAYLAVDSLRVTCAGNGSVFYAPASLRDSLVSNSTFTFTGASSSANVLNCAASSVCTRVNFVDNTVTYSAADGAVAFRVRENHDCSFENNRITITLTGPATGAGVRGFLFATDSTVSENLSVRNNKVALSPGKFGVGVYLETTKVENVRIQDCHFIGGQTGFSAFNILPSSEEGLCQLATVGNTYNGGNYSPSASMVNDQYGIRVFGIPSSIFLTISNNNINGIRSTTNSYGIHVGNQNATPASTPATVKIIGNTIRNIGRNVAGETAFAYGIYAAVNTATIVNCAENIVSTLYADNPAGIIVFGGSSIVKSRNQLNTICNAASSVQTCNVIWYNSSGGTPTIEVSNNLITNCVSVANTCWLIKINGGTLCTVDNNTATLNTGLVVVGADLTGIPKFKITNNEFDGVTTGISVSLSGSTVSMSSSVLNNSIVGVGHSSGISLIAGGTSAYNSLAVSNNELECSFGLLLSGGASGVSYYNPAIIGNTIKEADLSSNTSSAMSLQRLRDAVITGNTCSAITGALNAADNSKASIYIENSNFLTITGNHLTWNPSTQSGAGADQANVYLKGVIGYTITGNSISGATPLGGVFPITLDNASGGTVVGNTFYGTQSSINSINGSANRLDEAGGDPLNNEV